MANLIANAANIPVNLQQGSIPNVNNVLDNWLQTVTFGKVTKTTVGYQVVETIVDYTFQATVQPFSPRRLALLPEGQRAWSWFLIIAKAAPGGALLSLNVDDVGIWNSIQTRVMERKDYALYGTIEMSWIQDWTNSGPPTP